MIRRGAAYLGLALGCLAAGCGTEEAPNRSLDWFRGMESPAP
jgi:hypothetical protein